MLSLNKKKKVAFSALAVTALALPVSVLAVNKISSFENTYAATMPASFKDQNFYDCVLAEFQSEFPNETVASTGLTDAQLAKIKTVWCPGNDNSKISDATGIEKMTAVTGITLDKNSLKTIDVSKNVNLIVLALTENQLTSLDVSKNPELMNLRVYGNSLTSLDVSHNPKLEVLLAHSNSLTSMDISSNSDLTNQFTVDDILVKANISPIITTVSPSYDLSELNIINATQTISNTSNYTFNSNKNTIIVNNYSGAGGVVQVSSSAQGRTYKLQLPKFVKFDANGGDGSPSAVSCYSAAATGACSVAVPSAMPTRSGYDFKGYADSANAENAIYNVGGSISLTEPKTVYAVWNKKSTNIDDNGGNSGDGNNDNGGDGTGDVDGGGTNDNDNNNTSDDTNGGDTDDKDSDTSGTSTASDGDSGEEDDTPVPSTSKKGITPDTGANTKTEENGNLVATYALPMVVIVLAGILFKRNRSKKYIKFER